LPVDSKSIEGVRDGGGACLAQASLFAALAELVGTYGEDAVAKFAEGLAARVRNGEFSLALARPIWTGSSCVRIRKENTLALGVESTRTIRKRWR